MKRFLALLLTLALMFSLAACGGKDEDKTPPGNNDPQQSSSQQQEQEPSNTPDPDEPDNTGSESTPPSDTLTVADFLQVYGLSEDDCKPEHFVEFGELKMQGNAGEMASMGFVSISVDKEQTTEENIVDWFSGLFGKLESLSDTGKLYVDAQGALELTGLDELIEGNPMWEETPAFSCYYPYPLPAGRAMLMLDTSYDSETGIYTMMIWVAGLIK